MFLKNRNYVIKLFIVMEKNIFGNMNVALDFTFAYVIKLWLTLTNPMARQIYLWFAVDGNYLLVSML